MRFTKAYCTRNGRSRHRLLEVDSITKEEMQNFSRELLHSGEIEALAHGDLLPGDALLLSEILEKDLLAGIEVSRCSRR